jgi:hypothetical protein
MYTKLLPHGMSSGWRGRQLGWFSWLASPPTTNVATILYAPVYCLSTETNSTSKTRSDLAGISAPGDWSP